MTRRREELGFEGIPDTRVQVEPGTEWFRRLPEGQQRDILGPAAYEAHRSAAVKLEDFVGRRHDRRWGSMRYTKSLKDMLGSAEGKRWQERALAERLQPIGGGALRRVDRLIYEAVTGARTLTDAELQRVVEHLAGAGFADTPLENVRGRVVGLTWKGTPLRRGDRLPPAETHYVWHVLKQQEWPVGTSLGDYIQSVPQAIRHSDTQIFASKFSGAWQIGMIAPSGQWRGPNGSDWIFVEYRLATGHWVTAYQPLDPFLKELNAAGREQVRWLKR